MRFCGNLKDSSQRHNLSLPTIDIHIQHSSHAQEQSQQKRLSRVHLNRRSIHVLPFNQPPNTSISPPSAKMCLITTPRKEYRGPPPRPISNFSPGRTSVNYSRTPRRSASRTRYIDIEPRGSARRVDYDYAPRRSGRNVEYSRTSTTYVR